MRIVRVSEGYGRVDGDVVRLFSAAPWLGGTEDGRTAPCTNLLAPVEPSKVVCIGRNYAAHAKELGHEVPSEPLLFLKAPSSIIAHDVAIELPPESARVEHEAEIGVVIRKRCKNVPESSARDVIFGYTIVNDVTARDLQRKDVQFTRAKSFDTFCPIGPWIETDLDPRDVAVIARVDGAVKQHGRTRDMIFPIPMLIAYVSRMMTLEAGDIISTGTPEGVGPLVHGSVLETEVEGIGVLRNAVRGGDR